MCWLPPGGLSMELSYLSAEENAVFTIPKNTLNKIEATVLLTKLVSYYKEGHAAIFLFYPEFKENPLKIAGLDFEKFNGMISTFLERNPNQYLQKEFEGGLFNNPATVEHFQQNTLELFSPVAQLFPQLIPQPKTAKPKD